MTPKLETPTLQAELDMTLVESLDALGAEALALQHSHGDSLLAGAQITGDLRRVDEALRILVTDDPSEVEDIAAREPLARQVKAEIEASPEGSGDLWQSLVRTAQTLREVSTKFPTIPEQQNKVVDADRVRETWSHMDPDTKKAIQDAGLMATSTLRNIKRFVGVEDLPTVGQDKKAIDLVIKRATGLDVGSCQLTPAETLELFHKVRPETLSERAYRKLSMERVDDVLGSLSFDIKTKVRIASAATVLASSLLAGPALLNMNQAAVTKTVPTAHLIASGTSGKGLLNASSTAVAEQPTQASTTNSSSGLVSPMGNATESSISGAVVTSSENQSAAVPSTVASTSEAPIAHPVAEASYQPSEAAKPAETPITNPEVQIATTDIPSAEAMEQAPNTAEKYVISVLQLLAEKMGVPQSDTVTQEHINALLAWGFLEEGDLGNTGYYNLYNTGVDDPSLLATANSASGLQAFKSFDDGVAATVETMLTPDQNRIAQLLSNPNTTAEQFFYGLTYFGDYEGNKFWAQADSNSVVDGVTYTQAAYLEDLQNRYAQVMSNYAGHASILMGFGMAIEKNLYAPTSSVLYDGNGKLVVSSDALTSSSSSNMSNSAA